MLNEEMHAVVHGSVHGVGFRATAKQYADRMQLTGYVRNLPDGTVEICAQGEKKRLEELLALLQSAFGAEYIRYIDVSFHKIEKNYPHFQISR